MMSLHFYLVCTHSCNHLVICASVTSILKLPIRLISNICLFLVCLRGSGACLQTLSVYLCFISSFFQSFLTCSCSVCSVRCEASAVGRSWRHDPPIYHISSNLEINADFQESRFDWSELASRTELRGRVHSWARVTRSASQTHDYTLYSTTGSFCSRVK